MLCLYEWNGPADQFVGNYDYEFDYTLMLDGTIEVLGESPVSGRTQKMKIHGETTGVTKL